MIGERKRMRKLQREEEQQYNTPPQVLDLEVYWTQHAAVRLRQRFDLNISSIRVPERTIKKVGLSTRPFREYRVRRQDAVYVCKRLPDRVLILTVFTSSEN